MYSTTQPFNLLAAILGGDLDKSDNSFWLAKVGIEYIALSLSVLASIIRFNQGGHTLIRRESTAHDVFHGLCDMVIAQLALCCGFLRERISD